MRFTVMTLHHLDCPVFEVDWCTFGGLQKGVLVLLQSVTSFKENYIFDIRRAAEAMDALREV